MLEKNEGVWKCKVCGKIAKQNCHIRIHAELHIEGMSYPCNLCNKIFHHRERLRKHISGIHSELFSCDICGKSGLNRHAYHNHNRKEHKMLPAKLE